MSRKSLDVKMKKHKYKVRPGYGCSKLLIEFDPYSYEEGFLSDLRAVLEENGLRSKSEKQLTFSFEAIFDSPSGPFEIVLDEWNFVFVHADESQDAIRYLDRILGESGRFQKDDVDFADYA